MEKNSQSRNTGLSLEIHPLTAERWDDVCTLFGERGAYNGCWCMWWRQSGAEFTEKRGDGNKTAFKQIVDSDARPGLLAYHAGTPVGWCAIAPRDEYPRFLRSLYWKPIDNKPVWSVVCFYIDRNYRGKGVAQRLLEAAVDFAAQNGAHLIEGYPKESGAKRIAAASAYMGTLPMFSALGFEEVARRKPNLPIVRRTM